MKIEDIAKLMLQELKNSQKGRVFEVSENLSSNDTIKQEFNLNDEVSESYTSPKIAGLHDENLKMVQDMEDGELNIGSILEQDTVLQTDEIEKTSLNESQNLDISGFNVSHNLSHSVNNSKNTRDEIDFLQAVKERVLVLFEGLSVFDKDDIEARVELNLKFMEFLLASIDNRIENLQQ